MTRLVLFDIDGTLVHAAGAGRKALERAIDGCCGGAAGEQALAHLKLDGMTDRLIVREAMKALGRDFDDARCDEVLAAYVEHLAETVRHDRFRVLPGARELLDALAARGVAVALGTGNIAEGARLKLERGGLAGYFDWDLAAAPHGFGGDGEARELIIRAAVRRAAAKHAGLAPGEVTVVGDTPRDVDAGLDAGCRVVAVATGRFSAGELLARGAHAALASLAVPEALPTILG